MSVRYDTLFGHLADAGEGAFVPFVTLGDPYPDISIKIIDAIIAAGADALELGMPFSDPLADGSTIQGANLRALSAGTTPQLCFEILSLIRQRHPTIPIGLLVYANLVYARGSDWFYQQCQEAGVDSVLIADVPVEMSLEFVRDAKVYGVANTFIVPPNADSATLLTVAEYGAGYTYLVSRTGVTGAEKDAGMPITRLVSELKAIKAMPTLLGFGISRPEQVSEALAAGADGVIAGSAIVERIENNLHSEPVMLDELRSFVTRMKAATRNVA